MPAVHTPTLSWASLSQASEVSEEGFFSNRCLRVPLFEYEFKMGTFGRVFYLQLKPRFTRDQSCRNDDFV